MAQQFIVRISSAYGCYLSLDANAFTNRVLAPIDDSPAGVDSTDHWPNRATPSEARRRLYARIWIMALRSREGAAARTITVVRRRVLGRAVALPHSKRLIETARPPIRRLRPLLTSRCEPKRSARQSWCCTLQNQQLAGSHPRIFRHCGRICSCKSLRPLRVPTKFNAF